MIRLEIMGQPRTWMGAVWRWDGNTDLPPEQRNKMVYQCVHSHDTMEEARECAESWLRDLAYKKIDIENIAVFAEVKHDPQVG